LIAYYFGSALAAELLLFFPQIEPAIQSGIRAIQCGTYSQFGLDIPSNGSSIEVSPPIRFRIEWAGSQGMSPLLGRRPI